MLCARRGRQLLPRGEARRVAEEKDREGIARTDCDATAGRSCDTRFARKTPRAALSAVITDLHTAGFSRAYRGAYRWGSVRVRAQISRHLDLEMCVFASH